MSGNNDFPAITLTPVQCFWTVYACKALLDRFDAFPEDMTGHPDVQGIHRTLDELTEVFADYGSQVIRSRSPGALAANVTG